MAPAEITITLRSLVRTRPMDLALALVLTGVLAAVFACAPGPAAPPWAVDLEPASGPR